METSKGNTQQQLDQLVAVSYSGGIFLSEFMRECKKRFIIKVLQSCNGNQCRAARELGMHRNTLTRTLAELKLARVDWDPRVQLVGHPPRRAASPANQQRAIGA